MASRPTAKEFKALRYKYLYYNVLFNVFCLACHAGGREFEFRQPRFKKQRLTKEILTIS